MNKIKNIYGYPHPVEVQINDWLKNEEYYEIISIQSIPYGTGEICVTIHYISNEEINS